MLYRGWHMKVMLIALAEGVLTCPQLARLKEQAPTYRQVVTRDRQEIESLLPDIEIAFGNFPRDLLAAATSLRWYQQWSAGADWLLKHPEVRDLDLVLTNTSGVHAVPIAEHVLAFMLAFARNLPEAFANQQKSTWPDKPPRVFELAGKTVLLVGVGQIGLHTARLARGLGMKVIGVRRSSRELPAEIDRLGSLQELLPEADFVVSSVPLTDETRDMISHAEFGLMKDSAILINIGRGGTVDERALAAALREGRLAGAGLDVFDQEPLPADSELWSVPNLLITSHYSGDTPLYAERSTDIFSRNLERYLKGQPLCNVVDKRAGY